MAIKSRLLSKLKFTYMTTTMAATAHPQKLRPVLHNLEEARELCQQGLTEGNYAKYGEVYDGLIMAIKQILTGEAGKDAGEIVGLCKELLEHIMVETSKEEHFKKEMVFLPYKASMWDSLESVWRAAYEDKDNCLAYVIPIPYGDRNPDGTAKAWHCERDLFPKYVPTLDWQEEDLKTMHPDVIFIHNPYDDCNAVTSVDSMYYSRNLKCCTDKLVYVPYFVTGGKSIADHFCQASGVLNADYVICENEAIKKIYERNHRAIIQCSDEKFLALGSPKYDKVIRAKKEEYPIPEEWKKLIAGRKIVLYNTSLTAQMQNPRCILSKLQEVLCYFKENKDVVLWWRPHPLMEATFVSMIPQVVDMYRKIRDQYIMEGWGIYDNTAEMDRAIIWSDAYYGDSSSMLWLYAKTGKPIIVESLDIKQDASIVPVGLKVVDEFVHCYNYMGMIIYINRLTKKIDYKIIPKHDRMQLFQGYTYLFEYKKDSYLCLPYGENHILIYDEKNEEYETIPCDNSFIGSTTCNKFNNKIFISACEEFKLYVYNIKKNSLYSVEDAVGFSKMCSNIDGVRYRSISIKGQFLVLACQTNLLLNVDMQTEQMHVLNIFDERYKISNFFTNSEIICFQTDDNKLLFWEYGCYKIHELAIPNSISCNSKRGYFVCMSDDYGYVVSIKDSGEVIYMPISLETFQCQNVKKLDMVHDVHCCVHEGDNIFWIGCMIKDEDWLLRINLFNGSITEKYRIQLNNMIRNCLIKIAWQSDTNDSLYLPEKVMGKKELTEFLKQSRLSDRRKDDISAGNMIYKKIMRIIK